jgi:hypothetical protein
VLFDVCNAVTSIAYSIAIPYLRTPPDHSKMGEKKERKLEREQELIKIWIYTRRLKEHRIRLTVTVSVVGVDILVHLYQAMFHS